MIDSVEKHYNRDGQFIDYKIMVKDGAKFFVPLDPDNTEYQAIQEWAKIPGNNIIDPGA